METVLWALDLVSVVWLCFWALKQDGGMPAKKKKGS